MVRNSCHDLDGLACKKDNLRTPSNRWPICPVPNPITTVVTLLILFLQACAASPGVPKQHNGVLQTFRYRHVETTGLTDELLLANGKRIAIQFTSDSNADAFAALDEMPLCDVYGTFPDASGLEGTFVQRVYVVGYLDHTILKTEDYEHGPGVEPFQYFTLDSWYISAPFTGTVWPQDWLPGDPVATKNVMKFSEYCGDSTGAVDDQILKLDSFVHPPAQP